MVGGWGGGGWGLVLRNVESKSFFALKSLSLKKEITIMKDALHLV